MPPNSFLRRRAGPTGRRAGRGPGRKTREGREPDRPACQRGHPV